MDSSIEHGVCAKSSQLFLVLVCGMGIVGPTSLKAAENTIKVGPKDTFLKVSQAPAETLELGTEKCTLYHNEKITLKVSAKEHGSYLLIELARPIPGCQLRGGFVFKGHLRLEGGAGNQSYGPNAVTCISRGTGYYPDSSLLEGGYNDRFGRPLHTLQDYLEGKVPYVTVAMDTPYSDGLGNVGGRRVRIPELEKAYNAGRPIDFRVLDTGGAFFYQGASRIDICTRSNAHANDARINRKLTLIFPDGGITCDE